MSDTSRDRKRRTITAPNGARVVMPAGTSDARLLDKVLQWAYEPLLADTVRVWAGFDVFKDA